jgi:hypothetical protein
VSQGANASEVLIYEAERLSGPEGAVERGETPIKDDDAVIRLQAGGDIVVCSSHRRANRSKARELIEAAFGSFIEDAAHGGRMALPHFHPGGRTPEVHAFFEPTGRHARRKRRAR